MTSDKRRYTRVHFRGDIGQAHRILGAKVLWSNQEVSDVYDLSYKGIAASRPALVSLKPEGLQTVRIELGERAPFLIPTRVVWISEQSVGLEFGDISAEAHLQLHSFLTDKLIGQNMRAVDPRYFSPEATFQHWFQGPQSTHLFLWCDADEPSKITQVMLDFDGQIWQFENRRVVKGDELNERALKVLGQIASTELRLKDVIEKVASQAS